MNHVATKHKPSKFISVLCIVTSFAIAIWLGIWLNGHHGLHETHPQVQMPPYWYIGIIPFVIILGSIALLPLLKSTHHWWENNLHRYFVAMLCAIGTIGYMIWTSGHESVGPMLDHAIMADFIPFIILLFSLYVISGGIYLSGDLEASPEVNTAFLAIGALSASFIGTTGASMLLIRPILSTNSQRKHVVHTIVVFIFLVSNIGGTLLPIGDPPLFLGYLRGVPFLWTLGLWPMWAVACVIMLFVYYVWDSFLWRKETEYSHRKDKRQQKPIRIQGYVNFIYIAGIVASAAFIDSNKELIGTMAPLPVHAGTCHAFLRFSFVTLDKSCYSKGKQFYIWCNTRSRRFILWNFHRDASSTCCIESKWRFNHGIHESTMAVFLGNWKFVEFS